MADPALIDGRGVAGGAAMPVAVMNQIPIGGGATAANQTTELARIGDTTDAGVSTDANGSMSAKLRGLIILIVNLLTRWPASLGQKAMSASLAVVLASDQSVLDVQNTRYTTVANGELQGSASALQLPSVACKLVRFRARATNAGNVYLGASGVTVPDGTTDTTTGFSITPGADTGWLPVDNLNRFYRICDNATDALTYMALS